MPACSALGCRNRPEMKLEGVTFHRFPKENVLRAAWIVAMRRKNWLPTRTSVLCNEHFSEDLMDRTSLSRVRLKENAIPNVFKDPSEKSKVLEKQKPPEKHLALTGALAFIQVPEEHRKLLVITGTTACVEVSGKEKSIKASTPVTPVYDDEETQSCDENTPETVEEECGALETAENESSNEYVLPMSVPERKKSPQKRLDFKALRNCLTKATAFVNEVIQLSDEGRSETSTKNVTKSADCSNSPTNESSVKNRPLVRVPKKPKSTENHLASSGATASVKEIIHSNDESASETPRKCLTKPANCSNSSSNESNVEKRPPIQVLEKHKSPENPLAITDATTLVGEVIQPNDERTSKTTKECAMGSKCAKNQAVCSNSPINKFRVGKWPPKQIPKMMCRPPRKILPKTPFIISNKIIQSSVKIISKDGYDVVQKTACSNSPTNESSVENRPPVQIPATCKSAKTLLPSKTKTPFSNNEIVRPIVEIIHKDSTSEVLQSAMDCHNYPMKGSSVENRPTVQIIKKCKFPAKRKAAIAISDDEATESSDENASETEYGATEPVDGPNSTMDESDVDIPLVDSYSVLYPKDDVDKIYLKNELARARVQITKYRKKIKILQQQNRRWKKRLQEVKHSLKISRKIDKSIFS